MHDLYANGNLFSAYIRGSASFSYDVMDTKYSTTCLGRLAFYWLEGEDEVNRTYC